MSLNNQQVEYVAGLARVKLTAKEKDKFTRQLGDILDYFEKLKQLNTQDIPITSQSIELVNIHRLDEIKDSDPDSPKNILNNAPECSGDYFKVNKIL